MSRLALIAVVLSVFLAAGVAYGASDSDLETRGPYAVGHMSFVFVDATRAAAPLYAGRPIAVWVWYPAIHAAGAAPAVYPLDPLYGKWPVSTSVDWEAEGFDPAYDRLAPSSDGPFPFLLFSPGLSTAVYAHISIAARLASHGFVVAVLHHFGDRAVPSEGPAVHVSIASLNRPRDMSFALTELLRKNDTAGDPLYGLIDRDRIAAGGWSLGGYAAMTLVAGDDLVCDAFPKGDPTTCVPSYPDPRVKALVLLDASNQLLKFQELARVNVPVIGMGQEWGQLAAANPDRPWWASWQARQHAAFSGHPAYRADLYGAVHPLFSDGCEVAAVRIKKGIPVTVPPWCSMGTPSSVVHRLVLKYLTAFLKTEVAGQPGYQHVLTPGYALREEPLIEFFVTEKRDDQSVDEEWPGFFAYFMHQPAKEQAHAEKDPLDAVDSRYVGIDPEE